MSEVRTEAGTAALAAEAERRVRDGERHADVADALGVAPSTLSDWARRGGWRRKDLSFERNAARGRIALAEIQEVAAGAREAMLKRAAEMKAGASAADAAMDKADPEGDGRPTGLVSVSAPQLSMAMSSCPGAAANFFLAEFGKIRRRFSAATSRFGHLFPSFGGAEFAGANLSRLKA
jgi:transposase-like protein